MNIKWIKGRNDVIYLSSELDPKCSTLKKVILQIGSWKREIDFVLLQELTNDEIGLSSNIQDIIPLPPLPSYRLKITGRTIYIGPVIGYLIIPANEKEPEKVFDRAEDYFLSYEKIGGIIFLFSSKQVDTVTKTILGYYYDPYDQEHPFKEGIFPYPSSIYRTKVIPQEIYQDLIATIGDNIFNGYFFDKWELWEWFSKDEGLSAFLPYTEKLKSLEQLLRVLDQFPMLYLKKRDGSKAKGIIKILKTQHAIQIFNNENECRTKIELGSNFNNQLSVFLHQNYILQQGIKVANYLNRMFDFRVIMQKTKSGWQCTGNIARFGKVNGIASNFIQSGFALRGTEALKKVFNLSARSAFVKEQEMIKICQKFCLKLEENIGHYADLGFDVIVDKDLYVWVLEINKLHDQCYPIYSIKDMQMYYKIKTNILEYAHKLTPFA